MSVLFIYVFIYLLISIILFTAILFSFKLYHGKRNAKYFQRGLYQEVVTLVNASVCQSE